MFENFWFVISVGIELVFKNYLLNDFNIYEKEQIIKIYLQIIDYVFEYCRNKILYLFE